MSAKNQLTGHGGPPVVVDPPYQYKEYPKMVYPNGKVSPDPTEYVVVDNYIEEMIALKQEITPVDLKHLNKKQLLDAFHPNDITTENTRAEIIAAVNLKLGIKDDASVSDQGGT